MLTPYTGNIPSFSYIDIDQADGNTVGGWIPLQFDQCEKCTFHNEWTGTYAGTITIQVSNDPRCLEGHPDTANAASQDITTSCPITNPAGAAGDDDINISDVSFGYIRMTMTFSAGTGTFISYFSGHS